MAGGDTYVIIYLKMQLKAIKTDGVLTYKGYEEDFVSELALDLDEEPDNVRVTLMYLLSCGLAETENNVDFFFPYSIENTGSETATTQRVRAFRERQKTLHCNTDETVVKQIGNGEIEIEKEIDTRDRERSNRFTPPTIEDVKSYCSERGNHVDAEHFHAYYTANGWKVGKNPMKDWKAAVRTWERNDKQKVSPKIKSSYDHVKVSSGDDTERLAERLGING